MFKGWIDVEDFVYRGSEGSFCIMARDEVSLTHRFVTLLIWATGESDIVASAVEVLD